MSRAPIETRPSTARWLIAAREAAGFANAPDFLTAVKAEMGKAPSYSTYAQWEAGSVTPRRSTLKLIEQYHAAHETAAEKAPAATPDLATALVALTAELTAWRTERQELVSQVARLAAQVAELVADRDGSESSARAVLDAPDQ
jgi:hypothetical protein